MTARHRIRWALLLVVMLLGIGIHLLLAFPVVSRSVLGFRSSPKRTEPLVPKPASDAPIQRMTQRGEAPSLPSPVPVVLIRRSGPTPGESTLAYQRRVAFIEGFERFASAVNLSFDERQRILLALYDYQEANNSAVTDVLRPPFLHELGPDVVDDGFEDRLRDADEALDQALLAIVGWEGRDLWMQYCTMCEYYLVQVTEGDPLILSLAEPMRRLRPQAEDDPDARGLPLPGRHQARPML